MRKNYSSDVHAADVQKKPSDFCLSPRKATVDRILAFSAAYWTIPVSDGITPELILN